MNDFVEKLFSLEGGCPSRPEEVMTFLGKFGVLSLAYAGDIGRNPGYIFRGELTNYPAPLRTSLEREFFPPPMQNRTRSLQELLDFEKRRFQEFWTNGPATIDLLKAHGHPMHKGVDTDIFWWLSLMQHYEQRSRLVDFTRDIRMALFFALEQYCTEKNPDYREGGLVIYCFPCRDLQHPKDDSANKSPFRYSDGNNIDMNAALGDQIGVLGRERDPRYDNDKVHQPFGWDRAFDPNPRLSFQKGMLVYPYKFIEKIEESPGWLVKSLFEEIESKDPFHIRSELQGRRIEIPKSAVPHLFEHVRDRFRLTPATVYLDLGRKQLQLPTD